MNFTKLILFLIVGSALAGSQCTSTDGEKNAKVEEIVESIPQEDFCRGYRADLQISQTCIQISFPGCGEIHVLLQTWLRLSQKHQWGEGKLLAYNLLSSYYLLDGSYDVFGSFPMKP